MKCENCGNEMIKYKGIEVAQAFLLGELYTKPFNALYKSSKGSMQILQMGCFGLGVSRVLGACLELLSTENELKWPLQIAPALVCVITPKAGGKEESAMQFAHDISFSLNQLEHLKDNVILDQRTKLTIGYRFNNAKEIGLPYIVIIGKKVQRLI
ncbi:probable proline--tRNA ligase, mitochondrial [Centruroides sculpturatus]|uniref:probable proline--tRNA ligase, mitochondrial n=1 Tax=Centruroides sculpturatus TaxID=218467 RepID=UPI000C6EF316|nr:probable proline--tRNA ligase, mitochondrial [Centruroides sculpturatus]